MKNDTKSTKEVQSSIGNNIPIPNKWKEFMLGEFKRQVDLLDKFSEISSIIRAWKWTTKDHPLLWEIITFLDFTPACTAHTLALRMLFDEGEEAMNMPANELKNFTHKIRRYLQMLQYCGILTAVTLEPTDVGPNRYAPTIYLTKWSTDKDFNRVKEFYLTMGGVRGTPVPKVSKGAKELTKHNREMKAYTELDKYKTSPQLYNFYKCPKKHQEGLLRLRKPTPRTKEALKVHKCEKCRKKLDIIPHQEFLKKKEKELLKKFGI